MDEQPHVAQDAAALRLSQPVAGFPFYYRVVMAEGNLAGLRYKLVRGGQTWFADPAARSFDWDSYGEISYVTPPADRIQPDGPSIEPPR